MSDQKINLEPDGVASRFPTAYTILFALIVIVAALTWIVPSGQYDRAMNEEVGREIAVPGTYQTVDANPQGFVDVMLALVAGFYDPDSYAANAIDVALFVLFLGGFLGVCQHRWIGRYRPNAGCSSDRQKRGGQFGI